MGVSMNKQVSDFKIGDKVNYRNNPFDLSSPMDGRIVEIERIMDFRSRSTGNQCVKVKGDMMIRDSNELVLAF
jgi:hypothetical protein